MRNRIFDSIWRREIEIAASSIFIQINQIHDHTISKDEHQILLKKLTRLQTEQQRIQNHLQFTPRDSDTLSQINSAIETISKNLAKPIRTDEDIFLISKLMKEYSILHSQIQILDESIGIAQVESTSHPQQDRTLVLTENSLNNDLEDQGKIMQTALIALHDKANRIYADSGAGSCACITTAERKEDRVQISTSYLGDSISAVIVLDKNGKLKSSEICNPDLHNLSNDKELHAILNGIDRAMNTSVKSGGRVCGIAVSRVLGDSVADEFGMSHYAETVNKIIHVKSEDKVYLISTCDGAYEHIYKRLPEESRSSTNINQMMMTEFAKQLGKIISAQVMANPAIKPAHLASQIIQSAKSGEERTQSGDDISVIVAPLTNNQKPVTIGIFDGHGTAKLGHVVSAFAAKHFASEVKQAICLHAEIEKYVDKNKIEEIFNIIYQLMTDKVIHEHDLALIHSLINDTLPPDSGASHIIKEIISSHPSSAEADQKRHQTDMDGLHRRDLYKKGGTNIATLFALAKSNPEQTTPPTLNRK